jgi:BirA family biotin operon repressor/biotin-[acetyl-CoA-carboxylase] ligase
MQASGAERVLEALRQTAGETCSGAGLSEQLQVSRSQIWKHVEALRGKGYGIDGSPGGGYRLVSVPDRLYPEEILAGLPTRWLAREIRYFESIDSTNRVGFDLAREGAAHGTAVIAEAQTAGRGRLGRSFYSPPHRNLYTSVVLRPPLSASAAATVILAAAIAVAETVAESLASPGAVEIKWPNDVLLEGLKTSGILMELSAEATRVGFLVLGIGVNLNVDRESFPEEFRSLATSLASHSGRPVDRAHFTRRLFVTLEGVLDVHAEAGWEALRPRFQEFFRMPGRPIRVSDLAEGESAGVCRGIDRDGALLLERDDGERIRVLAGDVTIIKDGAERE